MFNFTTTTIVNSFVNNVDYKGNLKDGLYIKNVGSFKLDEVTKVYKKAYEAESFATATLTVPSNSEGSNPVIVDGAIYRLAIDIELYKSESSLYARPWPTKGKTIYAEAVADSEVASDLASKLKKNVAEYMNLVYDKEILTITNSGAAITVTGVEGSQIIKSIILERWDDDVNAGDTYAGGKWVKVVSINVPSKGKPGFGTYQHLIHNIVLPTYENMKYGSTIANAPELKGQYTQYVITKKVNRDPYGTGAVGQVLVSETQHVFWVESRAVSAFETAIKEAGTTDKTFDANDADKDNFGETILNN